jgi:hypothetical protein
MWGHSKPVSPNILTSRFHPQLRTMTGISDPGLFEPARPTHSVVPVYSVPPFDLTTIPVTIVIPPSSRVFSISFFLGSPPSTDQEPN